MEKTPMTRLLNRRRLLAASGALCFSASSAFGTANLKRLYQARTIVTGQRDETRIPGMKLCLRDVLVRVSGDPRLATDPALDALTEQPELPVKSFDYRDLYAYRPIKDEQGTRDRPYEMTVEYEPSKIDAMLKSLGSRPWLADRPRLYIFLAVSHIGSQYVLSNINDAGGLQREAFNDAAYKYALSINFPTEKGLQDAKLDFESLPAVPLSELQRLTELWDGEKALAGTLSWSREKLGWISTWRMESGGREYGWGSDGGNFDAAFRQALGGAAQILSGNGDPA
jgi:uncharacterized protein